MSTSRWIRACVDPDAGFRNALMVLSCRRLSGRTRKALALMITLGLTVIYTHVLAAAGTLPPPPNGVVAEALPDNPGRILARLSAGYAVKPGYEVRFHAGPDAAGSPAAAVPVAPGEDHLTQTVFSGTVHSRFYLFDLASGQMVIESVLPPVTIAALPSITPPPSGMAVEALPGDPGRIRATVSQDYTVATGHEVRFYVGIETAGNPAQSVPVMPGEDYLTQTVFNGSVYPWFYLVDLTDGQVVSETALPPVAIAVPADTVAPVLSNLLISASSAYRADGSVATNEAGGALYWVATTSATGPSETQILAGQDHTGSPAPGGSGVLSVAAPGPVPVNATGLVPETGYHFYCCHRDPAGNVSNIVTASVTTPAGGSETITVEDFTRDLVPFHSKRRQGTPAVGAKDQVLALKSDATLGSQHAGVYKRPGQDALPAGLTISGDRIDITSGFTGWLEGWDFTGFALAWRSGEVRLRNSILGERDGLAGLNAYLDIYPAATVVEIINNDFLGPNGYGGAGVAIKYRTDSSDAAATGPGLAPGRVAWNRFFGLSSDAIKPTGGIIERNLIEYDRNLDGPALDWAAGTTYAAGDLARNTRDQVFRSLSNGNQGNEVPPNKSDNTFWQSLDPHVDAINPATVTDPLTIRQNYVSLDAEVDYSVGMNNAVRSVPNTGATTPHERVDIHENVFIGPTGGNSKLIQSAAGGNPNFVADRFYNNWLRARAAGDILHPNQFPGTVWENNRDLDTDALIPGTADTVADPSLAVQPTAAIYLAEVMRSGTASANHVIEARAVSQGDGGAATTGWFEIATADAQGKWSGTLSVPRGRHSYLFEVRLQAAPVVTARTANRFFSGVLIAMHTQSDIASPALKTRTPWVTIPPEQLLDDNLAQMFYLEGFDMDATVQPDSNLTRVFLSNATPYSPGMAAMANTFIDLMPDTPVAFIMHTVSGTSPMEMANDNNPGRQWANDKKLHDFVVRDSNPPGLHAHFFSSSYKGIADKFAEALAPVFTGRRIDGTTFNPATDNPHTYGYSQTVRLDHLYADLYDPAFTKTMILPTKLTKDSFRQDLLNSPHFAGLFIEGEIDIYSSTVAGRYNSATGEMNDTSHANSHKEWGGPRRIRMWTLNMIDALEEQSIEQPLLDVVEVHDSNTVRIRSSSGPLSTIRKQLGLTELDNSYPAYGEVYGAYVNGTYVSGAYIGDDNGNPASEGWVYISRPSGSWAPGDEIGLAKTLGSDTPANGNPTDVDFYLDDALLSEPVVPSDIHNVHGLHAKMPEDHNFFVYSDIAAGLWAGPPPGAGTATPVLSGLSVSETATAATLSWSTDTGDGTAYWLVSGAPSPSVAEVKGGTPVSVTAIGAQAGIGLSGLAAGTGYYFHIVHTGGSGNDSPVSSVAFTTSEAGSFAVTPIGTVERGNAQDSGRKFNLGEAIPDGFYLVTLAHHKLNNRQVTAVSLGGDALLQAASTNVPNPIASYIWAGEVTGAADQDLQVVPNYNNTGIAAAVFRVAGSTGAVIDSKSATDSGSPTSAAIAFDTQAGDQVVIAYSIDDGAAVNLGAMTELVAPTRFPDDETGIRSFGVAIATATGGVQESFLISSSGNGAALRMAGVLLRQGQ